MTIRKLILMTSIATLSALPSVVNSQTATPTAQDQSTQTTDAELTRKIRSELMGKDLSMRAKNVTIVTIDGMVTLKGTVPTAKEKSTIGEVATRLAPNVRNDIVVKQ